VDGEPASLRGDRWLGVNLPAGAHTVEFRYQPWDVPLGLVLSLAGMLLAVHEWHKADPLPTAEL
jgi:uncharacterized membrane protein YfhO